MTTYNTGNSIGSADPRDLYDNAQVIDQFANSDAFTTKDRLGQARRTIAGMNDAVNQALANAGYVFVGDYEAGIELTTYNQVVRDTNGEFWRVSGSTELPYTTDGSGLPEDGAFVTVGDAALRQELADGTAPVTFTSMPTVDGDPIVESGSNSDGEWVRWADGTQTMSGVIYSQLDAANSWLRKNITYPKPVKSGMDIRTTVSPNGYGAVGSGYWMKQAMESRTSTGAIFVWSTNSQDIGQTQSFDYVAVGRWK